jgi:tetratricopeptide (TPR) repeat protein
MKIRNLALVTSALLTLTFGAGCNRVRAKAAFKDGNKNYKEEKFKEAIKAYEQAVEFEPDYAEALFYLANSYQALYRPGKDDAENVARLDKAIEFYKRALEANKGSTPNQKTVHTNTLAALTGIYSEAPKQDFKLAFEYGNQLVQEHPNDTKNLYALAGLYERFDKIDDAEATYKKVTELNPKDVKACGALAAFYNKPREDWGGRSKFDQAIEVLERCAAIDPNDASGYYKVATFFWDKAYRDPSLNDQQKNEYADKGLEAVDKAVKIKPDYWEALISKGLLFRVKASTSKNPKQRQEYLEQAANIQKLALDLRKQQQAASGEASPAPGTEGAEGAPAEPPKP